MVSFQRLLGLAIGVATFFASSVLSAAPNNTFQISYLESARDFEPAPGNPRPAFVYLDVKDYYYNPVTKSSEVDSTTCMIWYNVSSPPLSIDNGFGCYDISFTVWFAKYTNSTQFELAVNHRYGRDITKNQLPHNVNGRSGIISPKNYPGSFVNNADAGFSYFRYSSDTKPINLPYYGTIQL